MVREGRQVDVVGLTKDFGALRAVDDVTVSVRPGVVTGFLGGLATFSTFSAEVVTQLQQGHTAWALATALAHLAGSFALTALGIFTVHWMRA